VAFLHFLLNAPKFYYDGNKITIMWLRVFEVSSMSPSTPHLNIQTDQACRCGWQQEQASTSYRQCRPSL